MFERQNRTARVFVPGEGPDPARLQAALVWLQHETSARGTSGVIVAPQFSAAEGLAALIGDRALKDLRAGRSVKFGSASVTLTTSRKLTAHLTGQVVLALYMPAKDLARLDDLHAAAICALPWMDDDVRVWRQTWNSTDLTGSAAPAPSTAALSPVVIQALRSVTNGVNLSTGLSHPRDHDKAVWTFRILRDAGEPFNGPSVRAWAANNGWSVRGADDLSEVAEKIRTGKRIQVGERPWKDDILEQWRARGSE
ncbi:MAG TPA: DUF1889 family protein [Vicinamibacterales bacterium]